jgi:hypothetical protein
LADGLTLSSTAITAEEDDRLMSHIPSIVGIIERRLLINYRVDPRVLAPLVPAPFRPEVVNGVGMAGVCLIRLGRLRPRGMPAAVGLRTENAAHRIAIEWDDAAGTHRGVYIPRRDTDSLLTSLLGGRLFPGEHYRAKFDVLEADGHYQVAFASRDGSAHVNVSAELVRELDPASMFASLTEVSSFFELAPVGFSATSQTGCFDGLELLTTHWRVEPLRIGEVTSSFFEDRTRFPPGTTEFDSALLMRDIPVTWRPRNRLSALSDSVKPRLAS